MSSAPNKTEEVFGEPAWDVARLFPAQGHWSIVEYFAIEARGGRLVEFANGHIKVLAMPTMTHHRILTHLFEALKDFARPKGLGETMFAGIRVRLREDEYREPDVVFMLAEHADRMRDEAWDGANLVMEVVSQDSHRDLEKKRLAYARARISEYWIIDPRDAKIMVLTLDGDSYAVHGEFALGEQATSRLLPGFAVAVAEALAAKP